MMLLSHVYYTTSCLSVVGVTSIGRIALLEYGKYNGHHSTKLPTPGTPVGPKQLGAFGIEWQPAMHGPSSLFSHFVLVLLSIHHGGKVSSSK